MSRQPFIALGAIAAAAITVCVAASCNDTPQGALPLSPTPAVARTPIPAGPVPAGAQVIQIGDVITGTIHGNDPACDVFGPPGYYGGPAPCQPYSVVPPVPGQLTITLDWSDRSNTLCIVIDLSGTLRYCPYRATKPVTVTFPAAGGAAYGFGVEFDGGPSDGVLSPAASQGYTLTTTLATSKPHVGERAR